MRTNNSNNDSYYVIVAKRKLRRSNQAIGCCVHQDGPLRWGVCVGSVAVSVGVILF